MRRRLGMLALWLGATVAAALLVLLGVDTVADDVSESAPAAAAPTDATVTTTTTAPEAGAPASVPGAPTTSTTAARPGTATTTPAPAVRSTTPTTAATAPVTAAPTTTTTAAPPPEPGEVKTFNGRGGSVSIRFRSTSVELVVATPAAGYAVQVEDTGPARVRVRFRSDDHETRIEARAGDTTATVSENG